MTETTVHRSPRMLRRVAAIVGPAHGARLMRTMAAAIERDGKYVEVREAERVTFLGRPSVPPRKDSA